MSDMIYIFNTIDVLIILYQYSDTILILLTGSLCLIFMLTF
jgi:hypothetical protein